MKSEKDKMLSGELYDPLDPALTAAPRRARDRLQALSTTGEDQADEKRRPLSELLPRGSDFWLLPLCGFRFGRREDLGVRGIEALPHVVGKDK